MDINEMNELSDSLKEIRNNDPFDPYYYRRKYQFATKRDIQRFVSNPSNPDKERFFLKAMIALIDKELEEGQVSRSLASMIR